MRPSQDLGDRLRQVMIERAETIIEAPPLRALTPEGESRPRPRSRRAVLVLAAVVGLALFGAVAAIAVSRVLSGPSVTPVSDRFVIASGETDRGPWRLTAYRAEVKTSSRNGDESVVGAWCLDLDAAWLEGSRSNTTAANACTHIEEGIETAGEPIGVTVRVPEFDGDRSLIYGEVSHAVASVEIVQEGGETESLTIVEGPEELNLPRAYFTVLVHSDGDIRLVARSANGDVLARKRT